MHSMPLTVVSASLRIGGLSSFFTFGSVGAAIGRTVLLAPVLWGQPPRASRVVGLTTLAGAVSAALIMAVIATVGVDHVPNWAKVPPAIVFVQGVYGWVMTIILPNSYEPSIDLSAGDLAFALYGIIALPATVLFILVMTAASLLV
jgi:hypothetical protein